MSQQMKIELKGVDEFEKTLKSLPGVLQKRVVLQGFREGAKLIEERAKELVPKSTGAAASAFNKSAAKEKGKKHLWESIRIRRPTSKQLRDNREVVYSVRASHPLAALAEYGTGPRVQSKTGRETGVMPAFGYMRRAVDEKGQAAIAAITAKCKSLLESALKRHKKGGK